MKIHLQGPFDPSRCFEISRFWRTAIVPLSRERTRFSIPPSPVRPWPRYSFPPSLFTASVEIRGDDETHAFYQWNLWHDLGWIPENSNTRIFTSSSAFAKMLWKIWQLWIEGGWFRGSVGKMFEYEMWIWIEVESCSKMMLNIFFFFLRGEISGRVKLDIQYIW